MFTEGTVDVPVAGRMKKVYILVPAVAAAGYVGWRWYQARQDAASADTSTSDGIYTTPDQSEMGLSTAGGTYDPTGNTGTTTTDTTGDTISTNAQWTQKAVELLGNAGYDSATVYGALGDFLARRSLTSTEATIARAALAAAGQPPQNGPFSVIEQASTGNGNLAAPADLRALHPATTSQISLQWNAVPGALHYRIYRTDLDKGEPIGDSIDTKYDANALSPDTTYGFTVAAVTSDNKVGPKSNVYTAKTAAVKLARPTGLKASNISTSGFRVTCNRVPGAQYYRWYVDGRASGASDNPYYDFTGLKSKTTHHVWVAADTTNQVPGPNSAQLSVKTK